MWNESNNDLMNSFTLSPLLAQSRHARVARSAKSEERTLLKEGVSEAEHHRGSDILLDTEARRNRTSVKPY